MIAYMTKRVQANGAKIELMVNVVEVFEEIEEIYDEPNERKTISFGDAIRAIGKAGKPKQ